MSDHKKNPIEISGPPAPQLDTNLSLSDVLLSSIKNHNAELIAQIEVETGRKLTYGDMLRQCLSVVQGLKSIGVNENCVVSVVSFNSQEAHIFIIASIFIGATVAPIDPALKAEEMANLIDLVSPSVIFTEGGKTLETVEKVVSLLSVSPILVVSSEKKHSHMTFQSLLHPIDPEFKPNVTNPDEHIAFILFTSGTSGLSKGVMLSDLYLHNVTMKRMGQRELTIFVSSPVFWLSGVMMFLASMNGGHKMIFLCGQAKDTVVMSAIQNHKVNFWFASPTALLSLMNCPEKDEYDLSSLIMLVSGGATLSADSALRIEKELFKNKTRVHQGYGMTEIGGITTGHPSINKPGSCGVLRPGARCKIVDLETRESLGPGLEGEICLKCPYIMKGYINNPEATSATFDEDGWFKTGDIGYYDEDGFIFLVDRIKDLIKYKSYQIAPGELENVLRKHPNVQDVAVFGTPHPTDGDHATAYVVTNKPIPEHELHEFVAERVSEKKQLRGGIKFVESILTTSTGKPNRRALRAQHLAKLCAKRPQT